jgi:hypothetical protein
MTEPQDLDRYIDDFGRRLGAAAPVRPRPRMARLGLAGGVLAGVAAAAGVAVLLATSGERLDPVAEAQAALAAPGEIVHMQITSTFVAPGVGSVPPPQTTEQWSAPDPPRWRFVQTIPPRKAGQGGAFDAHGPITGRQEISYAHGVQRSYNADRDTLTVNRGFSDAGAAARVPSPLSNGSGSGDLQTDLRAMLAGGDVTDEGEVQVGGRTLRRLVSVDPSPAAKRRGGLGRRLVYDVDPQTFAPVQATLTLTVPSRPGALRLISRMHVDAYERIPLTAATAGLLRIRTTPHTKVVVNTAAQLRARELRFRRSCHKLKSGTLACKAPPIRPPKLR